MPAGRPRIDWNVIRTDPVYGAIWDVLRTGPKTLREIQEALVNRSMVPGSKIPESIRQGSLLKRLQKLDRVGLIYCDTRCETLAALTSRSGGDRRRPRKRGRPVKGVWRIDYRGGFSLRLAIDHSDGIRKFPEEKIVVARAGMRVEIVVAGASQAAVTGWGWEQKGKVPAADRLFEQLESAAYELGRDLLATDPSAVRAQKELRAVVRRNAKRIGLNDRIPYDVPAAYQLPEVKEKLKEAVDHCVIFSIRVRPAYWSDKVGLPLDLTKPISFPPPPP